MYITTGRCRFDTCGHKSTYRGIFIHVVLLSTLKPKKKRDSTSASCAQFKIESPQNVSSKATFNKRK